MEVISVVLGVAILAMAAIDLFRTVLDYDGYGPISQRLYRLTWSLFRIVATRLPDTAARGVLASAGPAMLLASVAT